jgi:hypothetical protein
MGRRDPLGWGVAPGLLGREELRSTLKRKLAENSPSFAFEFWLQTDGFFDWPNS